MKNSALPFVLLFIVISCTSPSKIMSSWVGKTKAELLRSWGPPLSVSGDGQGGEILVYSSTVTLGETPGQTYNNINSGISYTVPKNNQYERTRMFFVNANNVIYYWRLQGR
ncbi:MAG: hypothetical protein WDO19_31525 [Bacteroidota bacterium]